MSYKNDSVLVIMNKYGKANSDAKAMLYETYDKIRDITVSGASVDGSGYAPAAKLLMGLASLVAPSSFMSILGKGSYNIPGTSYSSSISGGNSITAGGQSSFGYDSLGTYPGFPSGGASSLDSSSLINTGFGSDGYGLQLGIGNTSTSLANDFTIGGDPTGGASSLETLSPMAGAVSGVASAVAPNQTSWVLPVSGIAAGIGGLVSSLAPYFGPFGIIAGLGGNILSGFAGAAATSYQSINGRILNNADVILQDKVHNIETLTKQLDAQSDVLKKMLKDAADGDKNLVSDLLTSS